MSLLTDIKAKHLVPGIIGHYAHGDKASMGLVLIDKGSVLPEHSHIHEQITYILEGQLDMMIGGQPFALTAGMFHIIPSNTLHSAVAATDCKVIDVFSPVREDYK